MTRASFSPNCEYDIFKKSRVQFNGLYHIYIGQWKFCVSPPDLFDWHSFCNMAFLSACFSDILMTVLLYSIPFQSAMGQTKFSFSSLSPPLCILPPGLPLSQFYRKQRNLILANQFCRVKELMSWSAVVP